MVEIIDFKKKWNELTENLDGKLDIKSFGKLISFFDKELENEERLEKELISFKFLDLDGDGFLNQDETIFNIAALMNTIVATKTFDWISKPEQHKYIKLCVGIVLFGL